MRYRRRLFPMAVSLVVLATFAAGGIGAPALARTPSAGGSAPSFGRPTISGIAGNGFEQDIRLDTHGRIYTSVPGSLSSTISNIWRSLDDGKTFKYIPASSPLTGKLVGTCPIGGGDTELATDSADHLYFNDLTLVPSFTTARSDDHGKSFAGTNCASVPDTLVDRQWYATDGDPTAGGDIYLTYDNVGQDPSLCRDQKGDPLVANNELVLSRSPVAGAAGATAGIQFGPSNKISKPCDEGIMGNVEVSPTTHHIFVVHDDADLDRIMMARCRKVPFTVDPSGLQCVDLRVRALEGFMTGGNFPAMAIDGAGNLYAVWEQAPLSADGKIGNSSLFFSSSTDEGTTWRKPVKIPTGNLTNNVMAWPAAGSNGRVDIAWYGTPAAVNTTTGGPQGCTNGGPDSVDGRWSLFMNQTLNGTAPDPTFTSPILASEHFIHRGSIQTIMGGQCGDRTLGDFLQVRAGLNGEANISYSDSNNREESSAPHGMYVRQIGGTSLYANETVSGDTPPTNFAGDPTGDARYEADTTVNPYTPNMDIRSSRISEPDATHYRITMKVSDLTSLAPDPASGDTDTGLVWLTQWLVPSATDPNGGKNFFVYMESKAGQAPTCWTGENGAQLQGGGVSLTYPGTTDITSSCSYTGSAPGTITITVPKSAVAEPGAINNRLYSVTTSSMTVPVTAQCDPSCTGFPSGSEFNLIDVVRAYDYVP